MVANVPAHPIVSVALQVAPSITETEESKEFATKTTSVASSIASVWGRAPTATVGGVCPQPELTWALQVAALTTDTDPL